jgi:hypothetical protein
MSAVTREEFDKCRLKGFPAKPTPRPAARPQRQGVFSPQLHNIHYIHYIHNIQYYAKGTASHIALYYLQYRISHKIRIKASLLIMNPKHSKAYVAWPTPFPLQAQDPAKCLF